MFNVTFVLFKDCLRMCGIIKKISRINSGVFNILFIQRFHSIRSRLYCHFNHI